MWHRDHYPIALRPGLRAPKGDYDLLPVNRASMGRGRNSGSKGSTRVRGGEGRRGGREGGGGGDPASLQRLCPQRSKGGQLVRPGNLVNVLRGDVEEGGSTGSPRADHLQPSNDVVESA